MLIKQKLPDYWKIVKLKDIADCLDHKRIPLNQEARNKIKGDIPYYGANGQLDSINKFIFDEELLLLAEDGGSWGYKKKCSYIIRGKSWVNNHAHILRVKNNLKIKYLEAFLNFSDLNKYVTGTTRGKLNQKKMNSIDIILPPLTTQNKIVSIIEKAEETKKLREEADELMNDFLKSVFLEMFGDKSNFEAKKLKDICVIQSGGTPSRAKKEYWDNGTIPWLGSTVCKDCYINKSDQFITEKGFKNSSAKIFKKGTILVALVGATIGKTAYLNFEATTNQNIAGIYPKDGIRLNTEYLFYAIQSLYPRFMSLSNDTFKMANLTFVRNLEIPLPPFELQNKFASIVNKIEITKEQQKESKLKIKTLFDALMQKAFTGKLVA